MKKELKKEQTELEKSNQIEPELGAFLTPVNDSIMLTMRWLTHQGSEKPIEANFKDLGFVISKDFRENTDGKRVVISASKTLTIGAKNIEQLYDFVHKCNNLASNVVLQQFDEELYIAERNRRIKEMVELRGEIKDYVGD